MCLAAKAFWSHLAAAWLFVADGVLFVCFFLQGRASPVVALLSEIQLKRTETSVMSVLHTIVQIKVGTSFILNGIQMLPFVCALKFTRI